MTESTSTLLGAALARLRRHAAVGSTVMLTLPAAACLEPSPDVSVIESFDWAQYEGKRDTQMVQYTGQWSSSCTSNTRFGCGTVAVHLNVRVKPAANADLAWKRVGVVWHSPDDLSEHTAIGSYVTTLGDGNELWDVTLNIGSWQSVVVFDTWYQDGTGHTWIDDNEGELHVVNAGPAYNVIRVEPWLNTVAVADAGVSGKISIQLADLDYDKQLELVATTDNWQTTLHFGMGTGGEKNKLYWVEDFQYQPGRERWQIDLDIPGTTRELQYAVVYRHGVVNGARTYEFWDNDGGFNYHVMPAAVQ